MKGTKSNLEQLTTKIGKGQVLENLMTKSLKGGHRGEPPPFEVQL